MRRRIFLKTVFTLLAAGMFFAWGMGGGLERKPNFLFILVDDLGWRDLGCCGSTFYETPNLDGLAASGMRFTNGYASCPVCSPTRASIMTGKHPARTGITDWIPGRRPKNKTARPVDPKPIAAR